MNEPTIYDELRGAVIDLPTGRIAPGWVEKASVIRAIDRVEEAEAIALLGGVG